MERGCKEVIDYFFVFLILFICALFHREVQSTLRLNSPTVPHAANKLVAQGCQWRQPILYFIWKKVYVNTFKAGRFYIKS